MENVITLKISMLETRDEFQSGSVSYTPMREIADSTDVPKMVIIRRTGHERSLTFGDRVLYLSIE